MEFLSFLLLITIIILIVTFKNGVWSRLAHLEKEVFRLREQLASMASEKKAGKSQTDAPLPETVPVPISDKPLLKPTPKPAEDTVINIPVPSIEGSKQPPHTEPFKPVPVEAGSPPASPVTHPLKIQPLAAASLKPKPRPGFFERHPDLEKFIGENLVSKIGIAILVLAIGFFVKYAIDNDWIGPVGRVGVGIICGGILVAVAHYLRNSYAAFSSVLIGGGLAVFYFTITLAYHQFHLFSQTVSFIIMVVITAFAVILSTLYNRQELAVIALIGGFSTPFMVSNGSGNYQVLFIYLIILNLGLLVIAYKRAWRLLNLLAFLFTAILFGSWLVSLPYKEAAATYGNGLLFATLFYLLFFAINIAHNIKEQKKFIASDFGILLANTCLYFGAGLYCLTEMGAVNFRGFFSIAMAVFNLGTSYLLFRNSKVDTNILYLLIGITLTFISLTAPIQLSGNYISLFWASEAVLLYWLFQKSRIRIIQLGSLTVWLCMLISLMMDITKVYEISSRPLTIIANSGFITTLYTAIASYILFLLRRKDAADSKSSFAGIIPSKHVFRVVAIILLYSAGFFEIDHQFKQHYTQLQLHSLYLIFYTLTFLLMIIFVTSRVASLQISKKLTGALLISGVLLYLIQIGYSFDVQERMLQQQMYARHFMVHWISALLTAIILYRLIRLFRSVIMESMKWLAWIVCAVVIIFLTAEIHLLVNAIFYSGAQSTGIIQRVYVKAGWPILWGICSFCFMWLGMRYKYRSLRIISLTLFLITLLKLFAYDIVDIPVGGKIAAFFSLGVLLLIVSFMYQRLKKIIIDHEEKAV